MFGSLKQSCGLHRFNTERCGCFVVSGCVAQVRAENVNRVNCRLNSVGKRSGFEVRWRPVLSIERGDPEVSAVQAPERRGAGEDGTAGKIGNMTTSRFSFCIYSPWLLFYKQPLKMFGKSDLMLFDIWNVTGMELLSDVDGFLLSQHLSSHMGLLASPFARCKIKNSTHRWDFSLYWHLNPGLLRPLRLCVWLLKIWFGQVLL